MIYSRSFHDQCARFKTWNLSNSAPLQHQEFFSFLHLIHNLKSMKHIFLDVFRISEAAAGKVKSFLSCHLLQCRFLGVELWPTAQRGVKLWWLNKGCLVIYSTVLQKNICCEKGAVSPEEALCYRLINAL